TKPTRNAPLWHLLREGLDIFIHSLTQFISGFRIARRMPARHKTRDNDLIARMNAIHARSLQRAAQREVQATSPTTRGCFFRSAGGTPTTRVTDRWPEKRSAVVFCPLWESEDEHSRA